MPKGDIEISAEFKSTAVVETPEAVEEVEYDEDEVIILTINETEMIIFGETVKNDVAPIIVNERTMLPIRVVAEALGATVGWDDEHDKVTVTKGDTVIEIFIGSAVAFVNGDSVDLDAPAFIENSRTYLPVRFVSENLDATVLWDAETEEVTIIPEA